jgi:hypothetical protein
MPASGHQDHTTSPSARKALSSAALLASIASRPASVTIASRPSVGRDDGDIEVIWSFGKPEYFCREGWTDDSVICPSGGGMHGGSGLGLANQDVGSGAFGVLVFPNSGARADMPEGGGCAVRTYAPQQIELLCHQRRSAKAASLWASAEGRRSRRGNRIAQVWIRPIIGISLRYLRRKMKTTPGRK